ncbi:hypothetical protein EAE99_002581 [Botrytis elliptica]|nr:hypothetical protein EAE99_002581 [Botrytis elliptica]
MYSLHINKKRLFEDINIAYLHTNTSAVDKRRLVGETNGDMEAGFLQGRTVLKKKLFVQTLAFETFVLIVGHKSDLVEMNFCYGRVHSAWRVKGDKMMTLPPLLGFPVGKFTD